jgi:integrase
VSIKKLSDGRYEWRHRVGGRHLKKVFTRRADAAAHDAKVKADLARGAHVDLTNKTTVAEYFRMWLDTRVTRRSTTRDRSNILRNHLEPTPLGRRPIVRVRPSEVQAWAADRARVLGPTTLNRYVSTLRGVFAVAAFDGLIARNPVPPLSQMSLPKTDRPKVVPLTVAQVRTWADHARPSVRAMILVQAGLGLRVGELIALRVADVDFLRREVHITEQIDPFTGKRAPLKTANSRRVVPLPQVTAEVLAEHIRQFPPGPGGLIFISDYIAIRSNGRPYPHGAHPRTVFEPSVWMRSNVSLRYRQALKAAGLPDGISSHDLRHHCASVLLDAGEPVQGVAEWLGDTPLMVLKVYGHLMPNREDRARRAVDAAWQAADETAPDVRGTAGQE